MNKTLQIKFKIMVYESSPTLEYRYYYVFDQLFICNILSSLCQRLMIEAIFSYTNLNIISHNQYEFFS